MIKLNYIFGDFSIYDDYIVVIMKEGITVTPDFNKVLIDIAETYFSKKPFVYITHRKNSYAVDPSIYFETSKIQNLIGFSVVSESTTMKNNIEIEKMFLKKPFNFCKDIDEAIAWANELIANFDSK